MNSIIETFIIKAPKYPSEYKYLFEKYCRKGGGSEEERLDKVKVFANYYELYLYAFFLGMRKRRRIPFVNRGKQTKDSTTVSYIKEWTNTKLRDYAVACVLGEANTPLRDYDFMSEKEIKEKSVELRNIMEEYAYGGLAILDAKFKEDKNYFDELFAFTEYVFE